MEFVLRAALLFEAIDQFLYILHTIAVGHQHHVVSLHNHVIANAKRSDQPPSECT